MYFTTCLHQDLWFLNLNNKCSSTHSKNCFVLTVNFFLGCSQKIMLAPKIVILLLKCPMWIAPFLFSINVNCYVLFDFSKSHCTPFLCLLSLFYPIPFKRYYPSIAPINYPLDQLYIVTPHLQMFKVYLTHYPIPQSIPGSAKSHPMVAKRVLRKFNDEADWRMVSSNLQIPGNTCYY